MNLKKEIQTLEEAIEEIGSMPCLFAVNIEAIKAHVAQMQVKLLDLRKQLRQPQIIVGKDGVILDVLEHNFGHAYSITWDLIPYRVQLADVLLVGILIQKGLLFVDIPSAEAYVDLTILRRRARQWTIHKSGSEDVAKAYSIYLDSEYNLCSFGEDRTHILAFNSPEKRKKFMAEFETWETCMILKHGNHITDLRSVN